jgi:hypothetical protein
MAFELRPSQGTMFRNDRKQGERDPDYRGTIVDPNGNEYKLSGWKKTSSKGVTYLSLAMTPKTETARNDW